MATVERWIGSAAPLRAPRLDLGAEHPTRAGAVRLGLTVDEDRVTACEVGIGLLHRGAEKLFEVRDFRQGLGLADRHDWQAAVVGETSLAMVVENALGIEVGTRATWLRTLALEHSRLHHLVGMLGWVARDSESSRALSDAREGVRRQLGEWTGSRLHPMLVRIGGVEYDVDDAWLDAEVEVVTSIEAAVDTLAPALEQAAPAGLAVVGVQQVDGWGLSGPTARAAGLARDLRVRQPHLAYAELPALAAAESGGDASARFRQLAHEARHAVALVRECAERLRGMPGPLDVRLPKIIRLPEGEYYQPLEAPLGEAGLRVVSRGEKTPWRVMLRTPSQPHVLALEELLVGVPLAGVEAVVASLGWVIGDVDK